MKPIKMSKLKLISPAFLTLFFPSFVSSTSYPRNLLSSNSWPEAGYAFPVDFGLDFSTSWPQLPFLTSSSGESP